MRAVRLVAKTDEYDRSPGLVLRDVPEMDGMAVDRDDGVLVAHDLLEHVNGAHNIGTVWDELEALGGIWEVRGRHGDLQTRGNIHSPATNVASDVTRMYLDWRNETRQHFKPTRCCLYDADFRDILDEARRDIPRNVDPEDLLPGQLDAYLDEALHRMRIGFRKARRRFRAPGYGYDSVGYDMFYRVRTAVAYAIKMIDYEGQEFILTYSRDDARVRPVEVDWE